MGLPPVTYWSLNGGIHPVMAIPARPQLRYTDHAYLHPAVEGVVLAVVIVVLWVALVVLT